MDYKINIYRHRAVLAVFGLIIFFFAAIGISARASYAVTVDFTPQSRSKMSFQDKYGAVDLEYYAKEMVNNLSNAPIEGEDSIYGDSKIAEMYSYLVQSNWIVTRSLLFGFKNFDAAADIIGDEKLLRSKLTKRSALQRKNMTALDKTVNSSGGRSWAAQNGGRRAPKVGGRQGGFESDIINNSGRALITASQVVSKQLRELANQPGFTSLNSIYMRTAYMSMTLMLLIFFIRVGTCLFKLMLVGSSNDLQIKGTIYECIVKLMLAMTYVIVLRYAAQGLMCFSELTRNAIIGASYAMDNDMATDLITLQKVRMVLLDPDAIYTASFTELLRKIISVSMTTIVQSAVSYISYMFTGTIIFVMVLLGDIMLAISIVLGPIIISIGMIEGFEGYQSNLFKNMFTFALYMPIAGIYMLAMCIINACVPNLNFFSYMVISWGFLFGATHIPDLASSLSGAAATSIITGAAGKSVSHQTGGVMYGGKVAAKAPH